MKIKIKDAFNLERAENTLTNHGSKPFKVNGLEIELDNIDIDKLDEYKIEYKII